VTTATIGTLNTTADLNVGGNTIMDSNLTVNGTLQGQLGDFITLSAQNGAITSLNTTNIYSANLSNSDTITTANVYAIGNSYLSNIYSSTITK
jgi:hypothetical protein